MRKGADVKEKRNEVHRDRELGDRSRKTGEIECANDGGYRQSVEFVGDEGRRSAEVPYIAKFEGRSERAPTRKKRMEPEGNEGLVGEGAAQSSQLHAWGGRKNAKGASNERSVTNEKEIPKQHRTRWKRRVQIHRHCPNERSSTPQEDMR